MPTFTNDVLPASPYENLGSPTQPWNAYFGTINSGQQTVIGTLKRVYAATGFLEMDGSSITIIEVDMSAPVFISTFVTNLSPGTCQFILFRIVMDSNGGWTFVWPSNFKGTMQINIPGGSDGILMGPDQIMHQLFLYDEDTGYASAIGPAVIV